MKLVRLLCSLAVLALVAMAAPRRAEAASGFCNVCTDYVGGMNCDWTIFPGLSDCHAGPTWCYGTPNCSGMGFLQKKEGPSVLAGFTLDGAAPVRFLPPCELAKLAAAAEEATPRRSGVIALVDRIKELLT